MIYLKEFETQAAYNAVKDNLPTPNVSLITDGSEVKYMKETTPPTPVEHEYVDLGLPSGTLWATMNIGASSITDTGLYYQWGDTQGYLYNEHEWEDSTYKWLDVENNVFTKYNYTDGKRVLDDEDDAVIAAWGNGWHIPTKAQCSELIDENNTSNVWVTNYQNSGVNGLLITSLINNRTIFFPANKEIGTEWERISYQSNTTFGDYPYDGAYEGFSDIFAGENFSVEVRDESTEYTSYRSYGTSIRPVKDA